MDITLVSVSALSSHKNSQANGTYYQRFTNLNCTSLCSYNPLGIEGEKVVEGDSHSMATDANNKARAGNDLQK